MTSISRQVEDFLAGRHRNRWFRVNGIAAEFAGALKRADWEAAGRLMDEETAIRCAIVPARMTVLGEKLQAVCAEFGTGFATAGSGNGGCVWALAPQADIVPGTLGRLARGIVHRTNGANPSRDGGCRRPAGEAGFTGMRHVNADSEIAPRKHLLSIMIPVFNEANTLERRNRPRQGRTGSGRR